MNDNAELAHYGVPGMKWGVRKRRANQRITRYANSKPLAVTAEVGKYAVVNLLVRYGIVGVKALSNNNPAVALGASLVGTVVDTTALVKGIINTVDIVRTDRRNGGSND